LPANAYFLTIVKLMRRSRPGNAPSSQREKTGVEILLKAGEAMFDSEKKNLTQGGSRREEKVGKIRTTLAWVPLESWRWSQLKLDLRPESR
jgi:hypothetical protein